MKKIKFFTSLYKERDWLEEMAAQGWLLTDITLGFIYHFRQAEPCEKVFEIERFDISSHPSIQELNARKAAIEIAAQSGWEVVTQDEDINYYFMKDKAGNATDEFYHDTFSRKERAERFRKRYSDEAPISLLVEWLIISIFSMLILLLMLPILKDIEPAVPVIFGLIYIITTITEIGSAFFNITCGQRIYEELSLSREEWNYRKQFSVKKRFHKIHQLKAFLDEQSNSGLALASYENEHYLFEEASCSYDYFVDTKACVKKRLKQQEIPLISSDLKWYEMSIANAERYNLQPLGVIKKNAILYKRPHSEEPLPTENGYAHLNGQTATLFVAVLAIGALLAGALLGALAARLGI